MGTLPVEIIKLLSEFAPKFDRRTWDKAKVLLIGAILCIGKRTVTSSLSIMGYGNAQEFAKYHHVLNRACWSSRAVSEVLLRLMFRYLAQGDGPLVFGLMKPSKGDGERRSKHVAFIGIQFVHPRVTSSKPVVCVGFVSCG